MARFYSNENFPRQVTDELANRYGHDVLTTLAAGAANRAIPDEDVLRFATDRDRVLLTLNRRHFVRLHRQVSNHSGIVVCSFDPDFRAQAGRIHEAVEKEPDMAGKLIRVNRAEGGK